MSPKPKYVSPKINTGKKPLAERLDNYIEYADNLNRLADVAFYKEIKDRFEKQDAVLKEAAAELQAHEAREAEVIELIEQWRIKSDSMQNSKDNNLQFQGYGIEDCMCDLELIYTKENGE